MLYICCCYCNPGFELLIGLVASNSSEPVHISSLFLYKCVGALGGGQGGQKNLWLYRALEMEGDQEKVKRS